MSKWKLLLAGLLVLVVSACSPVQTSSQKEESSPQKLAEINTQLGIEYMRDSRYEQAMTKFQNALKHDPGFPLANTSIAVLYEKLGEEVQAGKYYQKAYRLDRKNPVTLNAYGQYLCRQARYKDADEMFQKAAADPLYSHPAMILTNAGICANQDGDQAAAEKYFRQALGRDPFYAPALGQMVRTSFAQQNYLATRAYLQRLRKRSELSPEFLWIAVRTETELGNLDEASSYALSLKNRFPDAPEAQSLQRWESTHSD